MTRMSRNQSEQHDAKTGRFLPGNNGRPKGSRNKLATEFLDDFYAKWQKDGRTILDEVAKTKPHEILRVAAMLLPKELNAEIDVNISLLHEVRGFVEAYRYALTAIGSDRAKLIESGNGSE
jgi:hypothetical protein